MLLSAVIFGLLGSFHCVGMCGPIAFLLPVDRDNNLRKSLQIVLYHLGRLLAYGTMGIAFGIVGKSFSLFGFQQQLSILVGIVMLVFIFVPYSGFKSNYVTRSLYRIVGKVKSSLGQELKKKRPDTFFTVGFLNGFLPCGLVYMAVFGAIASGNVHEGAIYMVLFGVGTIPLMTTAIWIGNFLSTSLRKNIRRSVPVFLTIIALLFIVRGLGLGIPYLSPKEYRPEVQSNYECQSPDNLIGKIIN